MRLALLDNRDSFVWNLVHLAHQRGAHVRLFGPDGRAVHDTREGPLELAPNASGLAALAGFAPDAVLVGPGPGHPDAAPLARAVFQRFTDRPVLGVCLGHQVLARLHGAEIERSAELGHGRPVQILHDGTGLFAGVAPDATAARYHSLCATSVRPPLRVTARSPGGEILAVAHTSHPHHGVQFHPESLLASCGPELMDNFLHSATTHSP